MRCLMVVLLSAVAVHVIAADRSWPQFRGPHGNGHAIDAQVPLRFGENQSVAWRTELPGKAWSSPVVVDGVVWLTSAIEQVPTEEEKAQLLASDVNKNQQASRDVAKAIDLKLISVDFESGSILKTIDLASVEQPDAIHTLNSYASPTPMIAEDHIYCHFGTFGTFCVQRTTGDILWKRRFPLTHSVGPGSSPLVCDDVLVLIQDGCDGQYVIGLDRSNGETKWEVDRPELDTTDGEQKKSFCTPITVTDNRGRQQVICLGARWIVAYDPATGKEIWKCHHGDGFSIVPRPVCDSNLVYFSTGYNKPSLVAVRIDGDGDVSQTHIQWTAAKGIPAKPSPILLDGRIYVIDDTGVASCFDASDGTVIWKQRIGGNYSASPVLAGGNIFFASQEGKVTVLKPGPDFQQLAENQIDDRIMASPAIYQDSILLRTERAIYRFD